MQESLTNVGRHAGRVAATVSLRHDGGYLYVDAVNDGGAAPAAFTDGTGAGWPECESGRLFWAGPWTPDLGPAADSPSVPSCR